ncbi:hypothetical protein LOTGIDRAFT_232792 [Lottia gigantea]|uniref:Cadherin domain-containing protein n=1 Tax=Lottia gigantea TaxID=225164 RepID=V4BWM6_LOTGI|nr:hypothetical protein LOTGIDRAFT_232792 [Lottia gigantea]ESO93399.1 hypothetical protein LOTGIDRAFT_232792 [Lottia gigantea]
MALAIRKEIVKKKCSGSTLNYYDNISYRVYVYIRYCMYCTVVVSQLVGSVKQKMVVAVNVEYIGTLTIFLAILCNKVSSQNGCALLKNEYIIDVSLPEAPTENGNNYDRRFLGFRGAVGSIKLDIEQDDSTVDFHSNFKIYLGIADFNYGFCIKRIGDLDRDGKTSKYSDDNSILEYTIVCTDLSTSIKFYYPLIIRITDLNDNPPVFQNEPYQITVDKSTVNGSTLIRVIATDKDIDKNRHIVYGIESGAGTLNDASQYFHFPVISSGALSLKKTIDTDAFKSEGISSMNLNIFAMDMGRKSLRTDSSIKVNINFDGEEIVRKIDKPVEAEKPDRGRDHCVLLDRPEFANGSIKVKLPEVVSSSDLSAHPYKYRTFIGIKDTVTNINLIPDSEEVGVEYVIPQSGQRGYYIRIKQVIDRDGDTSSRSDDVNNLKFKLECESNDRITVFPLTIHITDINDNAPVFENEESIEFSVQAGDDEDLPREVFNISEFSSVSDKDLGANKRISYSISPVSDEKGSEYFIVDKSGVIHQVKHISDEEGLDYLYFNITVTDNARNVKKRKSSSKTAKVEVLYKTTTTTSTTPKPVVCNIDTNEFTSHKHGIYHLEIKEVKNEQHLKDYTDEYTIYIGLNDKYCIIFQIILMNILDYTDGYTRYLGFNDKYCIIFQIILMNILDYTDEYTIYIGLNDKYCIIFQIIMMNIRDYTDEYTIYIGLNDKYCIIFQIILMNIRDYTDEYTRYMGFNDKYCIIFQIILMNIRDYIDEYTRYMGFNDKYCIIFQIILMNIRDYIDEYTRYMGFNDKYCIIFQIILMNIRDYTDEYTRYMGFNDKYCIIFQIILMNIRDYTDEYTRYMGFNDKYCIIFQIILMNILGYMGFNDKYCIIFRIILINIRDYTDEYTIYIGLNDKYCIIFQIILMNIRDYTDEYTRYMGFNDKYCIIFQIILINIRDHTDEYTRYIGFNDEAQISLVQHGDNDINPEEYFELIVEGNKQYIRLIKPIDRDGETESKSDDTNQVEFTVECKQNGPIKYYPIVIHIDDVNDNAPVFQNTPYLLNVNEATKPGFIVYRSISAIDKDLGTNREITYGIVPNPNFKPDYSSYFAISNSMEGEIILVTPLDFEKLQTKEFQLNISATNSAPTVERLSSYTSLSITVIDSDDLPPVFHYSSCNKRNNVCFNPVYKTVVKSGIVSGRLSDIYPVPENKLNETVSIEARDQDSLNHAIVFTIDESIPDGYTDYFTVETTGPNNDGYYSALVNQVKIVQRSSVQKLKLVLKATEDSSEDKMARAELDIVVIPSNLNPPRLVSSSGEFTGFIEENSKIGSFVLSSSSADSDRLQISVEDDDVLPSDPPRAYDYSISPDTVFDIDDEGFITNIAAVDREKMSQYSLTLTITETDTVEKHKVSTSLVVYILDVNDNAPMFTRKSVKVNITEGDYSFSPKKLALPIRSFVIANIQTMNNIRQNPKTHLPGSYSTIVHLKYYADYITSNTHRNVSALDDDTEDSGKLTYSILDVRPEGEENFKINKETGELTAKGQLNANILYSIRVQASDNGDPPRSSMSVIEVNTVPRPNSAPYFSKDAYKFNIPEDFETGKHVFQFEAFDPDNDELNYAITSGNIGQTFSIDSSSDNSGELVVANKVDFESIQSYDLLITATDKRGLTGETTVHINITDINDNDPIFSSDVYEGSLIEGDYSISPKQVLIVKAEDEDSSYNGQVEYAITKSSPPEPAISINSESGAIEVNGIVKGGTVYTMTVLAKDKAPTPKSSTARVKLTVIPKTLVNNAPVIPQSDYTVSVSEGTALSSEIVQISASDPDSDVLTYKIVNQIPESSAFQIDKSGIISNTERLDREEVDEYTLQVEVTDSQGLTSDTKVVIKVTDMNDNRPKFTHKNYVFSLVEGQMGQFVVAAFDKDEVETGNSLVTYSFSEPNDKFDISSDGKITTKAPLDREENENYEMIVVASDNGLPVMTSTASVRIQVTDTSDSVPIFNPSIYEVQVPEGKRNYPVVTVKAMDADVVKNVIYIFEDGDTSDFTIDSITGEIKTRKPLNVASKSFYSFTVTTTDGQDVSSALVSVTVVGEDEEIVKPTIIVSEPIIPDKQQPTGSEKPLDVGDDRPPVFSYPTCIGDCRRPEYAVSVQSAASLFELSLFPMPSDNPTLTVPLKAKDPNTPQSPLNFTISRTVPTGLERKFVVRTSGPDNEGFYSATVKQIEPLYVDKTPHVEVIVRATEDSSNKLYSEGSVYIDVKRYYIIEGKLTAESTAVTLSQMNILTFLTILTIFYLL